VLVCSCLLHIDLSVRRDINLMTPDTIPLQASREQEVAIIKSEAEAAQENALAELQKEHNHHMTKAVTDLASNQASLNAATTKIADLQTDIEVFHRPPHADMHLFLCIGLAAVGA
jgi:hypothetical protein